MAKTIYIIIAALIVILVIQVLVLYILGHTLICPCGYVKLWDNQVRGLENSQHFLDWYSFLHIMYGMMLYLVAWVLHKRFAWKFSTLFIVVLIISLGWEVFENTHYVINHYQISSVSVNYFGDSIL